MLFTSWYLAVVNKPLISFPVLMWKHEAVSVQLPEVVGWENDLNPAHDFTKVNCLGSLVVYKHCLMGDPLVFYSDPSTISRFPIVP